MPDTTDATARAVKLTKAQAELLREANSPGGQRCARNYKPAAKLYEFGLVSIKDVTPPFGWQVYSTIEGRAHRAARPRPDAATD